MSTVIVTGALAPYTQRLYDRFAETHGERLTVLVCETREPQRQWVLPRPQHFRVEVLPGLRRHVSYTRHVYFNPSVVGALKRLKPSTIVVEDFSPTMALAALYARATRTPYGIKTDGHRGIDPGDTSRVHRAMRRLMVPHAQFGICASEDSVALLEHWGLARERGTIVPIVVPWDAPANVVDFEARPFDLLFAGAINEHIKGAMFFADVVQGLQARISRRLRVRVTGQGALRDELEARLAASGVDAQFDGSLQAAEMPDVYSSAKLMLFPSRGDAWGLVANEAAMCGTPVIGSPAAIASKRLVEACGIGLVRPLDVAAWVDGANLMLESRDVWTQFASRRDVVLKTFNLPRSVDALAEALEKARPPSFVNDLRAAPAAE